MSLDAEQGAVLIIGAGQAGISLALALRERGHTGDITLVSGENEFPYQRPPLSKGFLLPDAGVEQLTLATPATLEREKIRYLRGRSAVSVDTEARSAVLDDGTVLQYRALVLATGAEARRSSVPGGGFDGVYTLRTVADATRLRTAFARAKKVVVLGGGFLGLEVATAASGLTAVSVLERSDRILSRVVSEPVSRSLHEAHTRRGVNVMTRTEVAEIHAARGDNGGPVRRVITTTGEELAAQIVVVAIGSVPRTDLAARAGIDVANGILVDEQLRTSAQAVWAIGDCARYANPFSGSMTRVESVQNAVDQARFVAATLTGDEAPRYQSVPWFWSHQGGASLQIAGIAGPDDSAVVEEVSSNSLVVHRFRGEHLSAVETVNNPRAHVRARRTLSAPPFFGNTVSPNSTFPALPAEPAVRSSK